MPCPFLIFSQSVNLSQIVDTNSNTEWQTVQIQIKPTDLDLHYLLRQGMSCSAREGLKASIKHQSKSQLHEPGIQKIWLFKTEQKTLTFVETDVRGSAITLASAGELKILADLIVL